MRTLMLVFVLLSCGVLFAQTNPYVTGTLGVNGNMGYKNPLAEAGFGVETQRPAYFFDMNTRVAFTQKLDSGNGHTIYASGMGYMKLGPAYFGGGLSYGKLDTSMWSKDRTAPVFGTMFNVSSARIRAGYQMAGNDNLNGARQLSGSVELPLTSRVKLIEQIALVSYYPTGQPQANRSLGLTVYGGVKVMLGKRPKIRQVARAGDD